MPPLAFPLWFVVSLGIGFVIFLAFFGRWAILVDKELADIAHTLRELNSQAADIRHLRDRVHMLETNATVTTLKIDTHLAQHKEHT